MRTSARTRVRHDGREEEHPNTLPLSRQIHGRDGQADVLRELVGDDDSDTLPVRSICRRQYTWAKRNNEETTTRHDTI